MLSVISELLVLCVCAYKGYMQAVNVLIDK